MSSNDIDLIERLHAVAQGFDMPAASPAEDVHRGRQRVRRNRGAWAAAAAAVAVVVSATAFLGWPDRAGQDVLLPAERPGVVVGGAPVWYDAKGLHRGDVVEQTPVEILRPERSVGPDQIEGQKGALALVRSGAVYLDPATGDVWFHAWGGKPRVVGRNSEMGPGGDPNGDNAAWFDGSELVVYDTAAGREISRTRGGGVTGGGGEHYPSGNGFLQVSAARVTWSQEYSTQTHDLRTNTRSTYKNPQGRYLVDVHDGVEAFGFGGLVVKAPGQVERRFPDLESHVRLSPSGHYILAAESTDKRHAAAIVDTRTGELWQIPKNRYPWIAWSYGDLALVDTEDALFACDPARRACKTLPAERPMLVPTS